MPFSSDPVPLNIEGVKALARALGIDNLSQLSRRSNIERSYLYRILEGERPAQASTVAKLANALKVPRIALLGNDDPALIDAIERAEAAGDEAAAS